MQVNDFREPWCRAVGRGLRAAKKCPGPWLWLLGCPQTKSRSPRNTAKKSTRNPDRWKRKRTPKELQLTLQKRERGMSGFPRWQCGNAPLNDLPNLKSAFSKLPMPLQRQPQRGAHHFIRKTKNKTHNKQTQPHSAEKKERSKHSRVVRWGRRLLLSPVATKGHPWSG